MVNPFEAVSFSDFDCVKGLIKHRGTVDIYRGIKRNDHPNHAGDIRPMDSELIAIFVSLDSLIDRCELNVKQRYIIERIMDGWTEQDLANKFKQDVNGITKTLNTICKRIVNLNNLDWLYENVFVNYKRAPFTYKKCSKCGEYKPLTSDFYYTDVLAKDGFKNKCRSCRN